jgi:hypothetical protein
MPLKPEPKRLSDQEYDKLTYLEKIEYAYAHSPEGRQVKSYWQMSADERFRQQRDEADRYREEMYQLGKKNWGT